MQVFWDTSTSFLFLQTIAPYKIFCIHSEKLGFLRYVVRFNERYVQELNSPIDSVRNLLLVQIPDQNDSTLIKFCALVLIFSRNKVLKKTLIMWRILILGNSFLLEVSFDLAEYTANVDALGTLRLLDAIRTCGLEKTVKFYQASTSELYGKVMETPQKETTPFYPRSPYGKPPKRDHPLLPPLSLW